jgi:hypothetical protein
MGIWNWLLSLVRKERISESYTVRLVEKLNSFIDDVVVMKCELMTVKERKWNGNQSFVHNCNYDMCRQVGKKLDKYQTEQTGYQTRPCEVAKIVVFRVNSPRKSVDIYERYRRTRCLCLHLYPLRYNQQINRLNTKRRLLYLKTQFVPRSKHFSSQL